MNKPVYLGLSILHISKTKMSEFQFDYIKSKYNKKRKLCYVDTDSLITLIKREGIFKDIAEDVESRFDIYNYEVDSPLPMEKN